MTEWPEAPRLKAVLRELAEEVDLDAPTKRMTEELITDPSTSPVLELTHRADPSPLKGFRRKTLVAAAVLMATIGGGVIANLAFGLPGQVEEINTSRSDDPPQPPTPLDGSLPILDRAAVCGLDFQSPARYLAVVAGTTVEVGISKPNQDASGDPLVVSIGPSTSWREQHDSDLLHTTAEPATVVYIAAPDIANTGAEPLLGAVLANTCSFPNYLVTTGNAYQTLAESTCGELSPIGFSGFTFADPGPPPTTCQLNQPTLILSPVQEHPDLDAWAEHFGCVNQRSQSDSAGNVITSYEECTTTLVHVQTVAQDVWANPIEGRGPNETALRIMSLPN